MKQSNNIFISKVDFIKILAVIMILLPTTLFAQDNPYVYIKDNKFYYQCEEFYPVTVNYGTKIMKDLNNEYHVSPIFQYCEDLPNCFTCGENVDEWHDELREQLEMIDTLNFNSIRLTGLGIVYETEYPNIGEVLRSATIHEQLISNPHCYSKDTFGLAMNSEVMYEQLANLIQEVIDIIKEDPPLDLKLMVTTGGAGKEMLAEEHSAYLAYIANRFKDEPVIFAYDLYNEPKYESYYNQDSILKYERAETCLQWYNAIKLNAPAHFVTIGTTIEDIFDWDPQILPVDFNSFHIYSWMNEGDGYEFSPAFERYKAKLQWLSESFDLPMYTIGETGFPGVDSVSPLHPIVGSEEEQALFAEQSLKYNKWYGTKGYSWWWYKDVSFYSDTIRKAKSNYMGTIANTYTTDDEIEKESATIFENYDPFEEIVGCFHPDTSVYYHPNPLNYTNVVAYGNVKNSDGTPLRNAYVRGWIKKDTIYQGSYSITDSLGNFKLYTSFDTSSLRKIIIAYPGKEIFCIDTWGVIQSPIDTTLYDLDTALLVKKPEFETFTVETGETELWDVMHYMPYKNIVVEEGAELNISSDIFLSEDAKIIVERGGKLIIDSARITSSCGLWQGIEVWGTASASQNPVDQGWVQVINGGTVENAVCGIRAVKMDNTIPPPGDATPNYNYTGGIVEAIDTYFINNQTAVRFYDYDYLSVSGFNNCEFKVDQNYIGSEQPENYMIIDNMTGIDITYCKFINETLTEYLYTGILSENSIIRIEGKCIAGSPCTDWENGEFINMNYGIYATAYTPQQYVDIRHTTFEKNKRGVYIGGITSPRITSNKFFLDLPYNIYSNNYSYGLYLDESTDYWVEDNLFEKCNSCLEETGLGMIVNHSGEDPNEIYLNVFNYVENAINVQGENRSSINPKEGLVIKCNDYIKTNFDETIIWKEPKVTKKAGMAGNQGDGTLNIEDMAGNIFHYDTTTTDYDDINNEANFIDYYYSTNATGYNVEPMDAQFEVTVEAIGNATIFPWTLETACESNINTGSGGMGGKWGKMNDAQTGIELTETILTAMIDGGDTEALNTEVETSSPPETVQVYNELMNESPNLSETVVESSIEKETVLPNAMIRDVMVANPHTAKSLVLFDKLDERFDPMPEYMKAQILAGRSIQNLKQELESQLVAYKLKKAKAMNAIVRYYREEIEDQQAASDSLLALYLADNTLKSNYRLAWIYMERGDIQAGENVLNNIPLNFTLNDDEQLKYNQMTNIYSLLTGLYENGNILDSLTENEITELLSLANEGNTPARTYARNILLTLDEIEYEEPILSPDMLKSAAAIDEYERMIITKPPQMLEVYPNPSDNYVIVGYKLETKATGNIIISDIKGNPMHSIVTTEKQDQATIITKDWKPGVYIATLFQNGISLESIKFSIFK